MGFPLPALLLGLGGLITFTRFLRSEVLEVLGVNPPNAKAFWAFFPSNLEEELARKEKGYRNRRPEDIEETIFRVTVRGGQFTIEVDDQVAKK